VDTRNITLSLPDRLLRDAKVIAAQRRTSVSAIVTELLEGLVADESGRNRGRAIFERIASELSGLGTGGTPPTTRDGLHER
jgi:hypothetical protein